MSGFLSEWYAWILGFHIIAMVAWMAGMLYLPRLFVYHAGVETGSETSETFKIMERRLLKAIINPSMIATWVLGVLLLWGGDFALLKAGWMHVKLAFVLLMSGLHGMFVGHVRKFAEDRNEKSAKFFRVLNEIPTVFLIAIVLLVVVGSRSA